MVWALKVHVRPPWIWRGAGWRRKAPTVKRAHWLQVDAPARMKHYFSMSSLAEIEKAAEALSPEQKQELMLFLGARLRAGRAGLPEPRQFSRDQIQSWIAEDDADLQHFREQS